MRAFAAIILIVEVQSLTAPTCPTVSAPEETPVLEESEWADEGEEDVEPESPHVPGHLYSSPHGVPIQRGMPYHTAACADSRASF